MGLELMTLTTTQSSRRIDGTKDIAINKYSKSIKIISRTQYIDIYIYTYIYKYVK